MNFDTYPMSVNFDAVIASPKFSALTKEVLRMLQASPYMTLGEFFSKLNNNDLTALALMAELAISHSEEQSLSDLIIIAHALSQAEGAEAQSEGEAINQLNSLTTLITCESLARKGLVKVFHENFTLGQDMDDKPVVQRLF